LKKENLQHFTKLRHVDIYRHWLRQEVQQGRIEIKWVATAEMGADGLTKLLPVQKHREFTNMLGLCDLNCFMSSEFRDRMAAAGGGVC